MSVNLCIDWGNTSVKAAIFDNETLQKQFTFSPAEALEKITNIISQHSPVKAIICSVLRKNDELENLVHSHIKHVITLDSNTRLPIHNGYLSGDTLGPDRIALVVAAYLQHPDKNNLVISAGTCVTYNFVQKNKMFRGGAISPGLNMRLQAMHTFTGKLPEVNMDGELILLGYDTATCMRSGAAYGIAFEIDGMISEYERVQTDFNAILTGGDAPFFASKIKSKIFADPDLLLKGLNLILNHNVPSPR